MNGNPYTNNLFLVDGVNNNDVGSNRTILVYPSVDTIAEFKMIRNSYGAGIWPGLRRHHQHYDEVRHEPDSTAASFMQAVMTR